MKKLTALLAVVALGLLSTLTANAQINLAFTHTGTTTTPPAIGFGINSSTAALIPSGNQNFIVPVIVFDMGFINFTATNSAIPGNFLLSSAYDLTVTAGAFTQTKSIVIDYNIVLSSPTASKITFAGTDPTAGTMLATSFNFVVDNNQYVITLQDNSVGSTNNKDLYKGFEASSAKIGNLEVDAFLTVNPVPEPSTYALMGASALAGLVGFRRFRSKKANKA